MLTVDPKKSQDAFERYQMPRILTKIESNGNGIFTVFPNVAEVADALGRSAEYLTTFFSHELGTSNTKKGDKCFVMGERNQEDIQSIVTKFVERFVLCKACRNPETNFLVHGNRSITLECRACSASTFVDPTLKLCNLILKKEAPKEPTKKGKKKEKRGGKGGAKKSKDEEEEEAIGQQLPKGGEEDEIIDDAEELPNPIEVMKKFLAGDPAPTLPEVVDKVFDVKHIYRFKERQVVAMMFNVLFDTDIVRQIDGGAPTLKKFLREGTDVEVIVQLEHLCSEDATLQNKFGQLLHKLYDCDVLQEGTITKWYLGKNNKKLPPDVTKVYKAKAKGFVEWLKQEEEEEESDEGDDGKDDGKSVATVLPKARTASGAAPRPPEESDEEEVDVTDI